MSGESLEENERCDFCDLQIDEDEALEPLYVGDPPEPAARILQETCSKRETRGMNRGSRGRKLLGRPLAIYVAVFRALQYCDDISVDEWYQVMEREQNEVFGLNERKVKAGIALEEESFGGTVNDDKVGVGITIKPKSGETEPDAMVCENCQQMFETL